MRRGAPPPSMAQSDINRSAVLASADEDGRTELREEDVC
jgi:hypothetical protein